MSSQHELKVGVDAYLQRIKYVGEIRPTESTLRALHRAHLFTVPFENLDISMGREIVCDENRILHKIVNDHRGGFCYELNRLCRPIAGAWVSGTLLSARVAREDGSYGPEFDHLTLRVDLEEPCLADVGFGECFLEPLLLESGTEQAQYGRVYRLTYRGMFGLEVLVEGKWKREYAFTFRPRLLRSSRKCATITRPLPNRISRASEYARWPLPKAGSHCRTKS